MSAPSGEEVAGWEDGCCGRARDYRTPGSPSAAEYARGYRLGTAALLKFHRDR